MDENGQFLDFGFDAEERYDAEIGQATGAPKTSLFRHFKMILHTTDVSTKKCNHATIASGDVC